MANPLEDIASPEPRVSEAAACVTCGTELVGAYCHACGEKVLGPRDLRVGTFVRRAAGAAFDADSRLWRTFRLLFFRPGRLTAEFVRGRREPYLHPFQVFLLANLVFFLTLQWFGGFATFTTRVQWHVTQPLYGRIAQELVNAKAPPGTDAAAEYIRRFDEATPDFANSMIVLIVPMLAAGLALFYARRRVSFVQHLAFALHFMAFQILFSTALFFLLRLLVAPIPGSVAFLNSDLAITLLLLVTMSAYTIPAVRTAYGDRGVTAVLRGVGTVLLLLPALLIYRAILFFAVYLTL